MIYRKFRRGKWWVIRRAIDRKPYAPHNVGLDIDIQVWLTNIYGDNWKFKKSTHIIDRYTNKNDVQDCNFHWTCDVYLPTKEDITAFILTWESDNEYVLGFN